MLRTGRRFASHLDDHLVRLDKNLYISPSDPMYHEKVIRYMDPKSPESHYKLGKKNEEKGNISKALYHYREVLQSYPSEYFSAANRAVRELERRAGQKAPVQHERVNTFSRKTLLYMKMLLYVLLAINLMLLVVYFGGKPISKMVSSLMLGGVGSDVTYEVLDIPYVMYFSMEKTTVEVENALHDQALDLSKEMPKQNILIYGLPATDATVNHKAVPLVNEDLKAQAFVIAQYHPITDTSVKIRFLNPNRQKTKPLTVFGANLVRTALQAYIDDHGDPPGSINDLVQDYPNNYVSFIPLEALTRSNAVSTRLDGTGGWVYNASAGELSEMFYPNLPSLIGDDLGGSSDAFKPLHILIHKKSHSLQLLSGDTLLEEKRVGLGFDNRTPIGSFVVQERVLKPLGHRANVYGSAGLGLGEIAIHGTYDTSSIGGNLSLGCIRLRNQDAEELFRWVPKGTQVVIDEGGEGRDASDSLLDKSALIPVVLPNIVQSPVNVMFHWLG
jgi:hypothetical protein